jgi:hypothetical protein
MNTGILKVDLFSLKIKFLYSLMKQDILTMELFKTSGQWNCVTYKDDVQSVRQSFLSHRKEN